MTEAGPWPTRFSAATRQRLAAKLSTVDVTWTAAVPRRPDPRAPAPLSPGQERLWFIDQLQPEHNPYHMRVALRVRGAVDRDALGAALSAVVSRHEVLRSALHAGPDGPVQVVGDSSAVPLQVRDLTGEPDPWAAALRLAGEHARAPFDLAAGSPVRAGLWRAGPAEWLLVVVFHHVVCDGWSLGVFLRELGAGYSAALAGTAAALPPLPVQYADFAAWQRGRLASAESERQLGYWRDRLAGAPRMLALPTDRPRPAVSSFRGDRRPVALDPALTGRLRAVCAGEGVTVFMFLLAAFKVLLARYAGTTDVVVGAPVAGRSRVELENLVGFFVNTLVLRTDLSGGPSVRQLLGRVRDTTLGAFSHQEVPFERLVDELQPHRALGHAPLFQALFVLQNTPTPRIELPEYTMEPLDLPDGTAKFDLSMSLREEPDGGVGGWLEYSVDLFDAATVDRLAGHFTRLVEGMVGQPSAPVFQLPLQSPEERRELLVGRNTPVPAPPPAPAPAGERCLHEVFAARAAATPDAPAVTCGARTLTYRQLDGWANQLARQLRGRGVGPGVLVGLSVRRSVELVVGILGVLKAGGAYVPMDPGYPVNRLAYLVADSGVRLVVTEAAVADRFADAADVLLLGEQPPDDAGPDPDTAVSVRDLAYVIYTSGSTGRPKGVMVEHRNVLGLFVGAAGLLDLRADDVWLLFHSASFDVSVWELWGALLYGGRLVVPTAEQVTDPAAVADLVTTHRVTRLGLTTSAFSALARAVPDLAAASAPLRSMVFAGEAMNPHAFATVTGPGWSPGAAAVNMYGTTETTVHASYHRIPPGAPRADLAQVGGPLPGYRFYVVDDHDEPVPVGVPGQLLVGGPGVARGYLNRPALTAQRFTADPHGAPGDRLYRTGDVVRWLPGGGLEYLGRADLQVKVRGYRVEPGEVEGALAALPGVASCAVLARPDPGGDQRLVAYVVAPPAGPPAPGSPSPGGPPSARSLRDGLRAVLPEHLVPTALVFLDELPLTANGKLDRAALPAPQDAAGGRRSLGVEYVAPDTEAERVLAEVWAAVLAVPAGAVGVHDNFFELGGDSLRTARVVAHLRERGWSLALRELFLQPTIAALAPLLVRASAAADPAPEAASFDMLSAEDRAALAAMLGEVGEEADRG